jgi:hypothetical protein
MLLRNLEAPRADRGDREAANCPAPKKQLPAHREMLPSWEHIALRKLSEIEWNSPAHQARTSAFGRVLCQKYK